MTQIRAGGAARYVADADDFAVREDRLKAADQIFNATVVGGELSDTSRRGQAAEAGKGLGLRAVAGRQALFVCQLFQARQVHTAADGRHHVVGVELDQLVHAFAVKEDRVVVDDDQLVLAAGRAGLRDDADLIVVAIFQGLGHVLGRHRLDDRDREMFRLVAERPLKRSGERAFRVQKDRLVREDLLCSE